MKKNFRIPHSFTIIFILITIIALLTWILPSGEFNKNINEKGRSIIVPGTYHLVEQKPQGLMDILMSMGKGLVDSAEIVVFLLIVGGAYGIIMKTGAIDSGISAAIRRLGNKDKLIIPILMFLFSIGGTVTGMWEEALPFYLVLIPLMVGLGYDSIVGLAIIALGAGVGTLGSTVNPFSTGIASFLADIDIKEGFFFRLILFFISVLVAIIYVYIYASKVKKNPKKSIIYHKLEEHREHFLKQKSESSVLSTRFTLKHKIILFIFILMIIFLTYSIIVLDWDMQHMAFLYLSTGILSALFSRMNETEMWEAFIEGAKDLLGAALVIGLARGVVIVAKDGFIIDTILNSAAVFLENFSKEGFIISSELVQIMIGFLIPSSSGHATLTIPIISPISDFLFIPRYAIVMVLQTASGLVNLITPTSGVLMAVIAMARISYVDWFKFVIPIFIIEFIISISIIIISIYF